MIVAAIFYGVIFLGTLCGMMQSGLGPGSFANALVWPFWLGYSLGCHVAENVRESREQSSQEGDWRP